MTIALSAILKDVIKAEGGNLNIAQGDLKGISQHLRVGKQVRKDLIVKLTELKKAMRKANREGNGRLVRDLYHVREYYKQQFIDLSGECMMLKLQRIECRKFIDQQVTLVRSADVHFEAAKVAEQA